MIPITIMAPTAKDGFSLNNFLSISNAFGFMPFQFSYKLISTIPNTQIINTNPILSKNGISNTPCSLALEKPYDYKKAKLIVPGMNLKNREKANPPMVANKAAFEVVRFQKKPSINMAKIPGLTKPVYS